MGLGILNKKIEFVESEIDLWQDHLNISKFIIPFSVIFENTASPDIYSGQEVIPFTERDEKYQTIFLNEFLHD